LQPVTLSATFVAGRNDHRSDIARATRLREGLCTKTPEHTVHIARGKRTSSDHQTQNKSARTHPTSVCPRVGRACGHNRNSMRPPNGQSCPHSQDQALWQIGVERQIGSSFCSRQAMTTSLVSKCSRTCCRVSAELVPPHQGLDRFGRSLFEVEYP
jgi:hypothetical protein